MKKPIGIMKGNGDIILTEYGIGFIVSCIKKGEVIDDKTLIKRVNEKLKNGRKRI